jgi:hypothetical protein
MIIGAITENAIDLVVIGASGTDWLDQLLIGFTTESVVQTAPCPVITLKCNTENISQFQRIFFTVDPDEEQARVVEELKKLQSQMGPAFTYW